MLTGPALGAAIEAARLKKNVSKKALADHFGISPPSIQDWVNRGTIDKEKLPELWRFFADVVGPEHWGLVGTWPETHPPTARPANAGEAHPTSHPKKETVPTESIKVPVIGTLELGTSQMFELRASKDGRPIGHVPAPGVSTQAYAVRVFGDDLYPAVRHGAYLVVDPSARLQEGELMLLESAEGQYLVCELVTLRDDAVTISPAKGGQRRTFARDTVAAMHPVLYVASAALFETAGP